MPLDLCELSVKNLDNYQVISQPKIKYYYAHRSQVFDNDARNALKILHKSSCFCIFVKCNQLWSIGSTSLRLLYDDVFMLLVFRIL
jgi:hypothetical protein